jgi:hypothetical protein
MATVEDIRNRKRIRSEFTKRMLDVTAMDLQVLHGVVYIRGVIKGLKGGGDAKSEVLSIASAIKNQGLAKDVIIDCMFKV